MAGQFASFVIALTSPLHVGAGRAGMIARCRRFVPGHLFSYAVAAQIGAARGGKREDFRSALREVLETTRFGPGFLLGEDDHVSGWPQRAEALIQGDNHVALDCETRSAADGALFEVETLGSRHANGRQARLGAGVWFTAPKLEGQTLDTWLGQLRLGGELKSGCGRTALAAWNPGARSYHGWGECSGAGLEVAAGATMHGPALDGAEALEGRSPLEPWLGRVYDYERGSFGSRLSGVALIRQHDRVLRRSRWKPEAAEVGLGCWVGA